MKNEWHNEIISDFTYIYTLRGNNKYVYACEISYYLIMSFILQPLFICIIILFNIQRYLFSMCCWCIWLNGTLFWTQKTFLLLPKESIWSSMNLVSTEVIFFVRFKYPIDGYNHWIIDVANTFHELFQGNIFAHVILRLARDRKSVAR